VLRFLAHRATLGVVVVIGVVLMTFVIARLLPGDPAVAWVGLHATAKQLTQARHVLGLDQPLVVQIWRYASGVVTGDWGIAIHTRQPVLADIAARAPASVELVSAALILALVVGIPLGLVSARWRGRIPDVLVRLLAVVGVSTPVFWMGLILQLLLFQKLGLLPVAGEYDANLVYTNPLTSYTHMTLVDALITGNWPVLTSAASHLIMPAVVVAAYPMGVIARMVRASVLDTLEEDHIRMVRALGFPERLIFGRFALKPALNPVISVTALVFAYSLTNTFLVEAIFDWPGLGSYAAASIGALDTPAIVGLTLLVAVVYVISNVIVDVAQAALDPRIRLT
jgi:peptide/nickel transport system permease protein